MKHRSIGAIALGTMAVASLSFGQEVAGTKEAVQPQMVTPHVGVSTRFYLDDAATDKGYELQSKMHVRPYLGMEIMDGLVSFDLYSYFDVPTTGAIADEEDFENYRGSNLYITAKSYEVGPASLGAYVKQGITNEGDLKDPVLALTASGSHKMDTASGALTLGAGIEYYITYIGNDATSTYTADDNSPEASAALAKVADKGESSFTGEKTLPNLGHETSLSVSFVPTEVSDLKLGAVQYFVGSWDEEVAVNAKGEETSTYKRSDETYELIYAKYKLNDNLSISNENWFIQTGLYEADAGTRYQNITRLDYTFM